MWHYSDGMGWWMLFGGLMWLAFLVLIVGAIVYLLRNGSALRGGRRPSGDDPVDIVRQRYARGEITREEFEQLRKDLQSEQLHP